MYTNLILYYKNVWGGVGGGGGGGWLRRCVHYHQPHKKNFFLFFQEQPTMGSGYIVYMSYSSIFPHTLHFQQWAWAGLTSYCKLSMTLLALLAVEVVHVGTCLHSFVKAGIVKAYEDYRADSC